jgi:hypothetical protein
MVWGADSQEIKKKFNTNDPFGGATSINHIWKSLTNP